MKKLTLEARKNPALNTKDSLYQAITERLKTTTDKIGNTPKLFVSFTSVDKLGIYPRSHYNTPLGIYSYPADYVAKTIGETSNTLNLPFAGDSPYANIFSTTGHTIVISDLTKEDEFFFYHQIKTLWVNHYSGPADPYNVVRNSHLFGWTDEINSDNFNDMMYESARYRATHDTPGGRLWFVTMQFATIFSDIWKNNNHPACWAHLFRKIGISGVLDLGSSIIHPNEPTQSVFFTKLVVKDVDRVKTKYHFKAERARVEQGKVANKRVQDQVKLLTSPKVDDPVKAARLALFATWQAYKIIDHIKDPAVRIEMLKQQPTLLLHMKNPSFQDQKITIMMAISNEHDYDLDELYKSSNVDKAAFVAAINELPDIKPDMLQILRLKRFQAPGFQQAVANKFQQLKKK